MKTTKDGGEVNFSASFGNRRETIFQSGKFVQTGFLNLL